MKHKLTVNSIKSNGGNISAENNFVRDIIESINDIDYEAFVTKRQSLGILPQPPYAFTILSGDPDVYNFSEDDLAAINAFGRYPNFKALIDEGTGVYGSAPDITDHYEGAPGFFSGGFIRLHPDGNGHALENTYCQFT